MFYIKEVKAVKNIYKEFFKLVFKHLHRTHNKDPPLYISHKYAI